MAVARCVFCGPPRDRKRQYHHGHKQDQRSGKSCCCGAADCIRPADVWLTDEEQRQYDGGLRYFTIHGGNDVRVL